MKNSLKQQALSLLRQKKMFVHILLDYLFHSESSYLLDALCRIEKQLISARVCYYENTIFFCLISFFQQNLGSIVKHYASTICYRKYKGNDRYCIGHGDCHNSNGKTTEAVTHKQNRSMLFYLIFHFLVLFSFIFIDMFFL